MDHHHHRVHAGLKNEKKMRKKLVSLCGWPLINYRKNEKIVYKCLFIDKKYFEEYRMMYIA